ncbi:LmbU family transcriptional regulator [Streptomyces sp. NBC_00503]|uniref:LmbU family transcriptional regulator n=1 Tax=Streptomyces sp. NBC_00503 TaxID=2903659 RepID=UPI002E819269|nr:LmbU family transcriptional regulator [Streptomyces sp. NBC_00503]
MGLRLPEILPFARWERAGRKLADIVESSSWCLGDWLVYGSDMYADRYRRAVEAAGLDYQTLRNYAWVARRFDIGRRRESLSFQHHAEVAALAPEEQDRWLDRAQRDAWSRNQLRTAVRAERQGGADTKTVLLPRVSVEAALVARWRQAAAETGSSLDDWIVGTLDRCAMQLLADRPDERQTADVR